MASVMLSAMEREGSVGGCIAHVCAVLLPLLSVGNPALAQGQMPKTEASPSEQSPKVNPDGWTSSSACGQCHQAIHAVWRQSLHANAWSNRVFQAARVRSDTRLKPDEARSIEVAFREVKAGRLTVTAALYYQCSTEALVDKEGEKHIEPVEMKFLIASRQSSMKPLGR